jgi:pyridoxal/pyridoxine/pyridoxamine kinase
VTSVTETDRSVETLLVDRSGTIERITPRRPRIPNGVGDLFAGLLLGHLLNGSVREAAVDATLGDLDRVLAASSGRDVLQLAALLRGAAG